MGGTKRKQGSKTAATITRDEAKLAKQVFGASAATATSSSAPRRRANTQHHKQLKPAWVDEDDALVQVQLDDARRLRKLRREEDEVVDGTELQQRLKKQFQSGHGSVAWADPARFLASKQDAAGSSDSEEEAEDEATVVRSTGKLLDAASDVLLPGTLDICRVKDANQHAPSNAAIQAVEFHSNGQLLLSAGLDKTLHLFQVDGTTNARVENVFVKDLPISTARFTLGGDRIVLSGPRSYYFSYDVQAGKINKIPRIVGREQERKLEKFIVSKSGKQLVFLGSDGYLSMLSASSYETEGHMKMNGRVTSASFCEDDRYLISTGSDGDVYKWDIRTRQCVNVQHDEGSLGNASIAASSDSRFFATGSSSGVVNVYDNGDFSSPLRPRKTLMQLTTQIDYLQFNPDSQILAVASRDSRDALKMIHVPSFTAFSNWPANKTPLQYVTAMGFSPNSGYFAVGNARGRVLLYRLTHFGST